MGDQGDFRGAGTGKPVVPISSSFKSNPETPGEVQKFLQALQTARQVVDTHVKAGATKGDLAKAYQEAFPPSGTAYPFFDYVPDPNGIKWRDTGAILAQQGKKGLKW